MVPSYYQCSYCKFKLVDGNIHDGEVCPSCGSPETLMGVEEETIPLSQETNTESLAPLEDTPIIPDTHGDLWQHNEQEDAEESV